MSKVTVVGAGNVGATAANVLAVKNIASEVVLIDIKFFQIHTAVESRHADILHLGGNKNLGKAPAIGESIVSDGVHLFGNTDFLQVHTTRKSPRSYAPECGRQFYLAQ